MTILNINYITPVTLLISLNQAIYFRSNYHDNLDDVDEHSATILEIKCVEPAT